MYYNFENIFYYKPDEIPLGHYYYFKLYRAIENKKNRDGHD
jgi:hypothetical protein